ncbi:MAG: hypothetical protein HRT57_10375, partial [Crocinitomicaceae bacterium]|nr:hypothetical protein [Crocinitomicaceae bacterium]
MKKLFFLLILATVVSCAEEFGDEVVGGNLTVFYTNDEDKTLASDLAQFYKN